MTKARDLANSAAAFASVSATELGYVDGVTSAIQTQMDAKAPSSTAVTLTGTQTLTNKTLTSPVIASVINNTLTSTTGDIIYASAANTPARLGIGSASNVLTVSGGIPAWAAPAAGGKVLQVVQATTTTETAINTGTMTDTTITATITPSSATSKVLILVDMNYYFDYAGSAKAVATQLLRGGTVIFDDGTGNSGTLTAVGATVIALGSRIPITYLDSPATTSATTYKVQANTTVTSGNFKAQNSNARSSIILMEIGA